MAHLTCQPQAMGFASNRPFGLMTPINTQNVGDLCARKMIEKLILVAVGGSVGALLRYFVSNATFFLFGVGFPWGTLAANVIGCFLIGVVVGVSERVPYSPRAALFITTGVLGAFTTFSAFGDLCFASRGKDRAGGAQHPGEQCSRLARRRAGVRRRRCSFCRWPWWPVTR